jgi:translation elongation factor EF-Ts
VESLQVVAGVLEHAVQLLREEKEAEAGHKEGRQMKDER